MVLYKAFLPFGSQSTLVTMTHLLILSHSAHEGSWTTGSTSESQLSLRTLYLCDDMCKGDLQGEKKNNSKVCVTD